MPVKVIGLDADVAVISQVNSIHAPFSPRARHNAGVERVWIGGDGTTTNRLIPTTVSGLESGVASVSASHGRHSCAVWSLEAFYAGVK